MVGFTFNKAIGGGAGGFVGGTFLPALLGLLHLVAPAAGAVNPILGLFIGAVVAVVTYLTPKNAAPKTAATKAV